VEIVGADPDKVRVREDVIRVREGMVAVREDAARFRANHFRIVEAYFSVRADRVGARGTFRRVGAETARAGARRRRVKAHTHREDETAPREKALYIRAGSGEKLGSADVLPWGIRSGVVEGRRDFERRRGAAGAAPK
jgi:hypothetical protein